MSAVPVQLSYDDLPEDYLAPNQLPYLSVSQVEAAEAPPEDPTQPESADNPAMGCWHKWATRYLAKVRAPQHPSAVVGSRVHVIAEGWLRDAIAPDLSEVLTLKETRRDGTSEYVTYYPGQIFSAGLPLLPVPGTVKVEGKFRFTTNVLGQPIYWQGAKDAEWAASDYVLHILDHKTTKDWRYQKTEPKLRADGQANLYALEGLQRILRGEVAARSVALDWITYHTRKPDARAVRLPVIQDQALERVAVLERTAQKVLHLYHAHRTNPAVANELPQNLAMCDKFGGCPYRDTPHCVRREVSLDVLFGAVGGPQVGDRDVNQYSDFLKSIDGNPVFGGAGGVGGAGSAPEPMMAAAPQGPNGTQPVVTPAPVAPAPVVVAQPTPVSRPPYWLPGDPLNPAQAYLQQRGAPISVIASAADVPPPPEVAATYVAAPVVALATVAQPAPAPEPPAVVPAAWAHGFDRPPVERGFINPPEAPQYAPASPDEQPRAPEEPAAVEVSDELSALTRDQLKPIAISLGVSTSGDRSGDKTLRAKIRGVVGWQAKLAPAPAAPAPVAQLAYSVPQPVAQPAPAPVPAPQPMFTPEQATAIASAASGRTPAPVAQPAPQLTPVFQPAPGAEAASEGFALFINCAPVRGEFTVFSDVLAAVMPRVRKLVGQPDYRMAEYGRGAGVLANEVRTYLLESWGPVTNRVLVVDARTPEGQACLGVLEEIAASVVRGF